MERLCIPTVNKENKEKKMNSTWNIILKSFQVSAAFLRMVLVSAVCFKMSDSFA
jgi:hypothetical protein